MNIEISNLVHGLIVAFLSQPYGRQIVPEKKIAWLSFKLEVKEREGVMDDREEMQQRK